MDSFQANVTHPRFGDVKIEVFKAKEFDKPAAKVVMDGADLGFIVKDPDWTFFMTPAGTEVESDGFAKAIGSQIEKHFQF